MLAGTGDCITPLIKEFLDAQDHFDVLPLIYALPGLGFFRGQIRKLAFPESKDEGLDIDNLADFAYPEEQFVRNLR